MTIETVIRFDYSYEVTFVAYNFRRRYYPVTVASWKRLHRVLRESGWTSREMYGTPYIKKWSHA